jgi:hypothetical protein
MRISRVSLAAALVVVLAASQARSADAPPNAVERENAQLKKELSAVLTELKQMNQRIDKLEAAQRAKTSAPPQAAVAAAPSSNAPGAPAQSAEGGPPPGVTPAGVPLGSSAPRGVSVGSAVKSLMPGPVTKPTSMAAGYSAPAGGQPQGVVVSGLEGVPKTFIPDIGAVGDFTLNPNNLRSGDPNYDPAASKFQVRDTQLILFSPIDPYTNAQISLDKPANGSFDIEEAYLVFNKLPYDLTVRAGQYRTQFGLINELDTFQLPMANRPMAIANFIGQDGLVEPGVEASAYVPNPWDADIKADFNMLSGVNPVTYNHRNGQNFDYLYVGSLRYARDIFTTGSMTSGVSFAGGPGQGGQAYLIDPYLQMQYAPTQRNIWTWSVESMFAERKGVGDRGLKYGVYSLLDWNFALRYHAGALVDVAEVPNVASGTQLGLSPILTWFISDNTRLRLQYTHTTGSGAYQAEDALWLQATFSLGNLKPLD